ncbi:MAG TPA: NAD-binding protein [Solirubrobacteraceae bacterium]|nr:NAD-binding protein [Solirubrobacteraceae bacterium]
MRRCLVLVGEGELADATDRALRARARVVRLRRASDRDIGKALEGELDGVLVVSTDDHLSLRLALLVESLRPGMPMTVTIFGSIVASQLRRRVPHVRVVSMGDVAAPNFAGPCLDARLLSIRRRQDGFSGVQATEDGPRLIPLEPVVPSRPQRLLSAFVSLLRPFEHSARVLTFGLLGFFAVLLVDTVAMALVLGHSPIDALYRATRIIVTVGPNPAIEDGPAWFKVFSTVSMLAALAFVAMVTAGIVERLLDRRLTTIVGRRMVPRRDHVVVVGLGQVGMRLCLLLRELGVPVVAIDRNPDNYNLARAQSYEIPTIIGAGGSRFLLERLYLQRARALASVTDDQLENLSVVVAALGMREDLRTVLRTGRGDVASETRSLFGLGTVRDPYRIAGTLLAAAALGHDVTDAFIHDQTPYLITSDDRIEAFPSEPDREARRLEGDAEEPRHIPKA